MISLPELKQAARTLLRQRSTTLLAIATLALGIGANIAIFSVLESVVLRPLPFPEPDRLVRLSPSFFSAREADAVRDETRSYEALSMAASGSFQLLGDGRPEELQGLVIDAQHFAVFGQQPVHGRAFGQGDREAGAEPVVILGYELWQRRFAGEDVIGRRIDLSGEGATARTVVGVMPPAYRPVPWPTDLYVPISVEPGTHEYEDMIRYRLIGRLAPGEPVPGAQTELESVIARLAARGDSGFDEKSAAEARVVGYLESLVGELRHRLWLLLAVVGAVLLIACTNVANLLLAQLGGRERELAVRTALGADKARLVRQLLTESGLLGLLGGIAGVGVAGIGLALLHRLAPLDLPRLEEARLDASVLAFALAVSMAASLLFGVLPALRGSHSLERSLREGGRGSTATRRQLRWNDLLVGTEIALCVLLAVGAGLLLKSLWNLRSVDPGFQLERVTTMRLSLPTTVLPEESDRQRFISQAIDRATAVPGVESAAAINWPPLSPVVLGVGISPDGAPVSGGARPMLVNYRAVTPDYRRTLSVPLIAGRDLEATDRSDAEPVGLINQTLARALFPGQDPVGRRIHWDNGEPWFTIVGVLGDVRQKSLDADIESEVYRPYAQDAWMTTMHLVARSEPGIEVLEPLRQAVWQVEPDVPISDEGSMTALLRRSMSSEHSYALLFGLFAGLALVLGAIGIYGVTAYTVEQRTEEIGVRLALGATGLEVVRQNLRRGLLPVALGLLVGLLASLLAGRMLSHLLFGVASTDPGVLTATTLILLGVATAAILGPARRAARVDPARVLARE